jgi:hypothetical protein
VLDLMTRVAGANSGADAYSFPRRPLGTRLTGLSRFVVTRGGEYCFLPGLRNWDCSGNSSLRPRRRRNCSYAVMAALQRMRMKAKQSGQLESNPQQQVHPQRDGNQFGVNGTRIVDLTSTPFFRSTIVSVSPKETIPVNQQAIDLCAPLDNDAVPRLCGYGIPDPILATTSDTNRVVLYADGLIDMDRFYVYEVPVPEVFATTRGNRRIRVTLAFDAPTRHTRASYLGVEMSFRLIRGKSIEEVIEHFRKRNVETEGPHPEMPPANNCDFDLGPQVRERGTLQSATFSMKRNPAPEYGETYYLVVRCERQWHPNEYDKQRFAVVVELQHDVDIPLYERMRERVEVRVRA